MTLGWRLAGDCDSCFAASFAEKRRRSRRRRWNIFADHRQQLSDLHAGSRRCCLPFSRWVVSYRVARWTQLEALFDCCCRCINRQSVSTVVDHSDVFSEQMRSWFAIPWSIWYVWPQLLPLQLLLSRVVGYLIRECQLVYTRDSSGSRSTWHMVHILL